MKPFYVGYLRLPRDLRRPLFVLVGLLLLLDAALALSLFRALPAPSTGAWEDGEVRFDGVFQARPYPLLRVHGEHGWHTVLLVSEGKHGAPAVLDGFDGQTVMATGYAIQRDAVTVLQLDRLPMRLDLPNPILPAATTAPARLEGEIVDAKCWTGAMNPGEGKAHKGCGSLCLLGGIPALFIADNGYWYLLADAKGGPIDEAARALVGERVMLDGSVTTGAGLAVLTVDLAGPT